MYPGESALYSHFHLTPSTPFSLYFFNHSRVPRLSQHQHGRNKIFLGSFVFFCPSLHVCLILPSPSPACWPFCVPVCCPSCLYVCQLKSFPFIILCTHITLSLFNAFSSAACMVTSVESNLQKRQL